MAKIKVMVTSVQSTEVEISDPLFDALSNRTLGAKETLEEILNTIVYDESEILQTLAYVINPDGTETQLAVWEA